MTLKKGDLVNLWLNKHCGVVTGIITDLYDRDRTMFDGHGNHIGEKWATIEILTNGIGTWPTATYKLKKIEEEQT